MLPPSLRTTLKAAGFLAAYVLTVVVLQRGAFFQRGPLWLPTGVAIAGLWLLGWRYWPVILLGTLIQRVWAGHTFFNYLPSMIGNTLEALLAVTLLRRLRFRHDFRRLRDGLALLAVVLAAPLASAIIGRTFLIGRGGDFSIFVGWSKWWRMNALGMLVVAPLLLAWVGGPRPRPRLGTILEGLGVAGVAFGVAWFLATFDPARQELGVVLSHFALPVALYAAMRFGVRGAVTATAGVTVLLTLGTNLGLGPFVTGLPESVPHWTREFAVQGFIAVVAATSLLMAAAIAEREDVLARAAREHTQHQKFLTSIDQNVNEGLFRISRDRRLTYVNQATARMLGYDSPDELRGMPGADVLIDPDQVARMRRAVQERGQIVSEELSLRRKDGTVLSALVSCSAVCGPGGEVEHFDGAVSDLTGYKQLEDRLRQTQKMEALGMLAGGVAHDFNNLLTVISGHAELLQESLRAGGPEAVHAGEIRASASRAARLTGQLLTYSRRQVLTPEVLDLRSIVDQSGGMLRRLISGDIELTIELADEELPVRVDRGQMEQVIVNLVLNARDAMPGGGRIHVSAGRFAADGVTAPADLPAGPLVCLSVRDTGTGMDADVLRQAFDPFFTTKEPGRGTGLGLSTVYGIARQSGGAVWLESAPGAGATARVCLPRVARSDVAAAVAPATGATVPAAAAVPLTGTILVVEDEPSLRTLLAETLSRVGGTVLTAEDGEAALEAARRAAGPLDLLVTDVVMPRMGGRELVTRLATERTGLRVLMISGYAWGPPDWTPPDGAIVAYLQKPFAPSALLEQVRACLAAPARPGA